MPIDGYSDNLYYSRAILGYEGIHVWRGPFSSLASARSDALAEWAAYSIPVAGINPGWVSGEKYNAFSKLEIGTRSWRAFDSVRKIGRWVLHSIDAVSPDAFDFSGGQTDDNFGLQVEADTGPDNTACFGPFDEDFCDDTEPPINGVGNPVISVTCQYTPGHTIPPRNSDDPPEGVFIQGFSTYDAFIAGQPGNGLRVVAYTYREIHVADVHVIKSVIFTEGTGEEIPSIIVPGFAVIPDDYPFVPLVYTIGAVYDSSNIPLSEYGPGGHEHSYNLSNILDGNTLYLGLGCNVQDVSAPPKKIPLDPVEKAKTKWSYGKDGCLSVVPADMPATIITVCPPSLEHGKIGDITVATQGVKVTGPIAVGLYGNGAFAIGIGKDGFTLDFGTDGTGLPPIALNFDLSPKDLNEQGVEPPAGSD